MYKNKTLSITEARKKLFKIAEEIQNGEQFYTLTEHGKPKMVMMSADEFYAWAQTIDVLEEFPDIEKDSKNIIANLTAAHYNTLEQMLEKQGYVVADKNKQKYDANDHTKKNKR